MDLTKLDKLIEKLHDVKVDDIMSKFAITTTPETTIADLAHLLMRFKISGVPVLDHNRKITGIVTATDLFSNVNKTVTEAKSSNVILYVKDLMTTNVFSVSSETSLYDAIMIMCDKDIHTLPVMFDKEIIGIIGRRDVINAFYVNT